MPNYDVSQATNIPRFSAAESGKIGQGVGRSVQGLIKTGMDYSNAKSNEEKVQSLLSDYNANTGAFGVTDGEGAKPEFKTRRLAQLLLPIDPELSAKYMQRATEQEQRAQRMSDQEKQDILSRERIAGDTDITKMKLQQEVDLARERLNKPAVEKDVDASKLYESALGAFDSGKYLTFFNSLHPSAQGILPNPDDVTREKIQTLVKKDLVQGATLGNQIAQSGSETTIKKSGAENAKVSMEQTEKDNSGDYVSVPKDLESKVDAIKQNYRADISKPIATVNSGNELLSLLGNGSSPIGGINAVAAINLFNKTMDPTAVVRKEDYEAVAGAGGLKSQVAGYFDKVDSGITLQPPEVKNLIEIVRKGIGFSTAKIQDSKKQAEDMADLIHISPRWVTGQQSSIAQIPKKVIEFKPQ